jgi:hypothetical protein
MRKRLSQTPRGIALNRFIALLQNRIFSTLFIAGISPFLMALSGGDHVMRVGFLAASSVLALSAVFFLSTQRPLRTALARLDPTTWKKNLSHNSFSAFFPYSEELASYLSKAWTNEEHSGVNLRVAAPYGRSHRLDILWSKKNESVSVDWIDSGNLILPHFKKDPLELIVDALSNKVIIRVSRRLYRELQNHSIPLFGSYRGRSWTILSTSQGPRLEIIRKPIKKARGRLRAASENILRRAA